jgi:hypothetical protein
MPDCVGCGSWFRNQKTLSQHRANVFRCKSIWLQGVIDKRQSMNTNFDPDDPEAIPRDDEPAGGFDPPSPGIDVEDPPIEGLDLPAPPPPFPHRTTLETGPEVLPQGPAELPPSTRALSRRRFIKYHQNRPRTYGRAETVFEKRQKEEEKKNLSPYRNFGSADGFELAEWFMEAEVSQSDKTRLLKTRMVSTVFVFHSHHISDISPRLCRLKGLR